jgi:hypothetical protein
MREVRAVFAKVDKNLTCHRRTERKRSFFWRFALQKIHPSMLKV